MPIQAIHGNERRHSLFVPAAEGAIVGAGAGLAGKYLLPLTTEEISDKAYEARIKEIDANKTAFNAKTGKYINHIKSKLNKTPAEDEFVKMFDGLKEGEHVAESSIEAAIANLEKNSPDQVAAFKALHNKSLKLADKLAKMEKLSYNMLTKHLTRPTGFFLATGAIIGTFVAIAHDLMKTEIKTLSDC